MTRPAIDPSRVPYDSIDAARMRRQSTPYKVTRTIARGAFWVAATFATVALFVLIASIDSLI